MAEEYTPRSEGDLDPEIWKNPTLGSVGSGPFLPEIERQYAEDYSARKEGREPVTYEYVHNYPTMPPSGSVPTNTDDFVVIGEVEEVNQEFPPVAEDSNSSAIAGETSTLPVFEDADETDDE